MFRTPTRSVGFKCSSVLLGRSTGTLKRKGTNSASLKRRYDTAATTTPSSTNAGTSAPTQAAQIASSTVRPQFSPPTVGSCPVTGNSEFHNTTNPDSSGSSSSSGRKSAATHQGTFSRFSVLGAARKRLLDMFTETVVSETPRSARESLPAGVQGANREILEELEAVVGSIQSNAASSPSSEERTAAVDRLDALLAKCDDAESKATWDVHVRILVNQASLMCRASPQSAARSIATLTRALELLDTMGYSTSGVHLQCQLGLLQYAVGRNSQLAQRCFQQCMSVVERSSASRMQYAAGVAATEPLDPMFPMRCMAALLLAEEQFREAELVYRGVLRSLHAASSSEDLDALDVYLGLAQSLVHQKRFSEAVDLLKQFSIRMSEQPPGKTTDCGVPQQPHVAPRLQQQPRHRAAPWLQLSCLENPPLSMNLLPPPPLLLVSSPNTCSSSNMALEPLLSIARIHHHHLRSCAEALPAYEAVVETSLGLVRDAVLRYGADSKHPELIHISVLHAEVLFNAGMCVQQIPEQGVRAAVGILEESIKLLVRSGCSSLTPRIRIQYARALRHLGMTHEALQEYFACIGIVAASRPDSTSSHARGEVITENFSRGTVSLAEVHAHIAHCLHFDVGAFSRAHEHYIFAIRHSGHQAATSIVEAFAEPPGCETSSSSSSPSNLSPSSTRPLRADTLSWILECDADCLRRLHRLEDAAKLLELRIDVGRAVGDACVAAMFALAANLQRIPARQAAAADVYEQLFALPLDALTTSERFDLACAYANFAHYDLGDCVKAAQLYRLALELDPMNPTLLVQFAWCARQLPDSMRLSVAELTRLYEQAVASLEIFKADDVAKDHESASASGPSPADGSVRNGFHRPASDEVYVLGEVAAFLHDVARDSAAAGTMYERALSASKLSGDRSTATPHVLANYAILQYYVRGDAKAAEQHFQSALRLNNRNFHISNLYAEFLISLGREKDAFAHVVNMIDVFPEHVEVIYHKLARLEERLGDMGTEESRIGVLRSYLNAVTGDRCEVDVQQLTDDAIEAHFSRSRHPAIANDALVFLHTKLKKSALAARCYAIVVQKFPNSATLLLDYARCCVDQGKHTLALSLFRAAHDLDPTDPTIVECFADFIASRMQSVVPVTLAEAMHLACLNANPCSAAAHLNYAVFLTLHLPSPTVATKHFKEALRLQPNDANIWTQYAAFAERQAMLVGHSAKGFVDIMFEAEKAYQTACTLSQHAPGATLALGLFLWRSKRPTEAWTMLRAAYDKEPNHHAIVSSCAVFVHEKVLHMDLLDNSGRGEASTEAEQRNQLLSLADKLYKRALKIDSSNLHVVQQYVKFLLETVQDRTAAMAWQAHADKLLRAKAAADAQNKPLTIDSSPPPPQPEKP